jgi:hypothetical protein
MNLGESAGEVGNGSTLPLVSAVFDLEGEGVTAPALFQGLAGIPEAGGEILSFLDQDHMVQPGDAKDDVGRNRQLCRSLRQNCYRDYLGRRLRPF